MSVDYVEVHRAASVGERIKIVDRDNDDEPYENGEIFTVDESNADGDIRITCGGKSGIFVIRREYVVLQPASRPEVMQEKRIEIVVSEVGSTLIRKNRDYGDSFAKQFAKYGVLSGLIRMDDKMRRLENLVGGAQGDVAAVMPNVDESIEDTLMDLAGYAILCVIELRKKTGMSADGRRPNPAADQSVPRPSGAT